MARTSTSSKLHLCPNCSSDLVQPVEWEPAGTGEWSVMLRCPECEVHQAGVFPQAELDAYEEELDRGDSLLRVAYLKLSAENMAVEVDAFAQAIHADLVLPEDF
jgi:hypothetical protein